MPRHTPWGPAQQIEELGLGLQFISTASHGGVYVPTPLLQRIPSEHRAWAAQWSDSENFYEEDDCIAAVIVAFPELFSQKQIESAKASIARQFPAPAVPA